MGKLRMKTKFFRVSFKQIFHNIKRIIFFVGVRMQLLGLKFVRLKFQCIS